MWNLADWARGGPKPPTPFKGDGIGKMGLVTHDRTQRKDVFYWYKANWTTEPMLYLAERRFEKRLYREVDIRVYSNVTSPITVRINGELINDKPIRHGARSIWVNQILPVSPVQIVISTTVNGKVLTDEANWIMPDALPSKQTGSNPVVEIPPTKEPGF